MIFMQLFFEFFKTGLFAVGGGLATLPFLSDMADKYGWFTQAELADMIAISESTPGPIGINMATYAGYNAAGILGGVVATLAMIVPSLIIVTIIARFLQRFKENDYVQGAFNTLRPAATGLIAFAGFEVLKISLLNVEGFEATHNFLDLFDLKSIIFFAVLTFCIFKFKKVHPVAFIGLSALVGIVFQF